MGVTVSYAPDSCFYDERKIRVCLGINTTYLVVSLIIIVSLIATYQTAAMKESVDEEGAPRRFEYENAAIATDSAACSEVGK